MAALNLKEKYKKEVMQKLQDKYNYKSVMSIPCLEKVVINRGIGEAVNNSKVVDSTKELMSLITGQKPVVSLAKKSISNFKLRQGQPIGCKVTLRSDKMYDFLNKLINVCIPKIRDFRGVPKRSFDGRGNYTLGLKEDLIFPEVKFDKIDQVRGFDLSVVTTASTDEEAYDLLSFLGMPFRKN